MSVVATGAQRLKAEVTGASAPASPPAPLYVETGVVKSVVGGYDQDPTITVTWRDKDVPASYVSPYYPTEGDTVLLIYRSPSVMVLGRLIGPSQEA